MFIENKKLRSRKVEESRSLRTELLPAGFDLSQILIIGIGNSGRADDGLGWAFVEALAQTAFSGRLAYRYQLQIEDAECIRRHPLVVFVDATEENLPDGFEWRSCPPAGRFNFSTHELSPETIAGLCTHVYEKTPQTYVLAVQGYEWGLKEGLSKQAQKNLAKALAFFEDFACLGEGIV